MLTYAQHSQAQFAAQFGRLVNNWLDDDSVQEAITQLEDYKIDADPKDVRDSIAYLATCINFRRTDEDARKYVAYILERFEYTMQRLCRRCGDKLEDANDLICGYHHLEA